MINFELLCEFAEELEASTTLVQLFQCSNQDIEREREKRDPFESISSCNDILVKLKGTSHSIRSLLNMSSIAQKLLAINRQKLLTILNFNISIQEMKFIFESRLKNRSSSLAIMSKYRKQVEALERHSPESRNQTMIVSPSSPESALAAFEALPKLSLKKTLYFNHKAARKVVIPFPKICKQQQQQSLIDETCSRHASVLFCR
jgi:hypothetical protein